jgi:hypothetical protein
MALDTLTGAPVPEPEDDTEVYEAGPLGVLQRQLAVSRASQLADRKRSWDNVAQALEKSRPSKSEMWFSLASALAQPTKTGSFGEVIGNVSQTLGESRKAQREFDTTVAKNQFERDQDLAELGSKYDLKGYDLQEQALKSGRTTFIPGDGGQWKKTPGQPLEWIPVAGAPTKTETWSDATQNGRAGQISSRGRFEPNALTVEEEASRAGQIDLAKESAAAKAMLPKARLNAENAFKNVDEILSHPGLSAVVGVPDITKGGFGAFEVPGTPAAGFRARLKQLQGTAFLEAYTTLKGGGAIANAEGQKAEQAVARMDTAQTEAEFREAMNDYKSAIRRGLDAMEEIANMSDAPSKASSGRRSAPTSPPAKGNLPPIESFYKE